jgi:hypothetical protein
MHISGKDRFMTASPKERNKNRNKVQERRKKLKTENFLLS